MSMSQERCAISRPSRHAESPQAQSHVESPFTNDIQLDHKPHYRKTLTRLRRRRSKLIFLTLNVFLPEVSFTCLNLPSKLLVVQLPCSPFSYLKQAWIEASA